MSEVRKKRLLIFCDGSDIPAHLQDDSNIRQLCISIACSLNANDPVSHYMYQNSGKMYAGGWYDSKEGLTLADRVIDVYNAITANYVPEDEIYLFGFSSGAYLARTLCDLIGAIGVPDLDKFCEHREIIRTYQKLRNARTQKEREKLEKELAPWTGPDSPGRRRMNPSGSAQFPVTCLALFGDADMSQVPHERKPWHVKADKLFGKPDPKIGDHVHYVYQALPLHDTCPRTTSNTLELTKEGKRKGQVLRKCWFSGDRRDIGGGHEDRDLADLALFWMLANIQDPLSLNIDVKKVMCPMRPKAEWGRYQPHNANHKGKRKYCMPTANETIHESVLKQPDQEFCGAIASSGAPIEPLQPLEDAVRSYWEIKRSISHSTNTRYGAWTNSWTSL